MLLCNESFASTNEREGSEIARQVVDALLDAGVKVVFVTHLFDLAHGIHASARETPCSCVPSAATTANVRTSSPKASPLPTSYGEDTYRRIFDGAGDLERVQLAESRP